FPDRANSAPPMTGAFAGVPFLVKDFPIEAGVKAEMGSEIAAGFTAAGDSELIPPPPGAGLVSLGPARQRADASPAGGGPRQSRPDDHLRIRPRRAHGVPLHRRHAQSVGPDA